MSTEQNIIEESRAFVKQIFDRNTKKSLYYHNWDHIEHVHKAVIDIVNNTPEVGDKEKEALELTAIFHDVAYTEPCQIHEDESVIIAEKFLQEKSYPSTQVALVSRLILATKVNHTPIDLLEKIIKDADYSHFGSSDYMDTSYNSLLKEINANQDEQISPKDWAKMCLDFVKKHQYHTAYAKENYDKNKRDNITKMSQIVDSFSSISKKKKKRKKIDQSFPEKGIETMFRVSLRNHLNLSRIADNKANTLISVNAIIISIVLSTLFPKLDNNPFLIYPGIALLIFSIITIVISILSTIPKTTHGTITRETVLQKRGNLIFFGNFHKMSLDDFEWGVDELMKDRRYLYKTLTRDLYYLGKVLNRKYTLLRYSYYVFVIGLIISTALFILSIRNIT